MKTGERRELEMGSSLRARGIRPACQVNDVTLGLIPACAGHPWGRCAWCAVPRAHPCVRGASDWSGTMDQTKRGSSLRARGIRVRPPRGRVIRGLIPACAGHPLPDWAEYVRFRVFPLDVRGVG